MTHLFDADPHGFAMRLWIGLAVAMAVALLGLRARALNASGAAAAVAVGTAIFAGAGIVLSAPLIAFFISGSALARIGGKRAMQVREIAAKGSARDAQQVLANGAVAALCALAAAACLSAGLFHAGRTLLVAAVASIAGAAGDTWSSELGALSESWPRLITTGARVSPGTSGAVTWLGTAAAVAGGAFIGAAVAPFAGAAAAAMVAIGAAAGLAGTLLDSLLGAAVQGAWHCDVCDEPSDLARHRCGAPARLLRGLRMVDNDAVNALTTATVAGLGAVAIALAG